MRRRSYEIIADIGNDAMVLDNLVRNLGNIQDSFSFSIRRSKGLGRKLAGLDLEDNADVIEHLVSSLPKRTGPIPILVTSAKFKRIKLGAHVPRTGMILSTARLGRGPSDALLRAFVCLYTADLISSTGADTMIHEPPMGCIGDAYSSFRELKALLPKMSICHRCRNALTRSIHAGRMTAKQVDAIERIFDHGIARRRCFILMPFAPAFDRTMNEVYAKLGGHDGWVVERADQKVDSREAMNNIIKGIQQADLIIADLTENNANVFYEVGYAHAADQRVVLVTRNLAALPFDLRMMSAHQYSNSTVGLKKLKRLLQTKYRGRT